MFRTRDFVLVFTSVLFLLMAITATAITQKESQPYQTVQFEEVSDIDRVAVLESDEEQSRAERLADMRDKVAKTNLVISAPEPEILIADEQPLEPEETEAVQSGEVLLCSSYQEIQPAWSPAGILFEEVEGARLVYRPVETLQPVVNASGTVVGTETVIEKDIILQLPVRSARLSQDSCIPTDVVGIAQDGSLIRNNEIGLYGVFGPDTLIGYALDGFPIYGTSQVKVDQCGGLMTPTGYRYHLTPDRTAIVYCFAGPPVQI